MAISTIDDQETRDMVSDALKVARRASVQATIAMICALSALAACGFLYAHQ